MAQYRVCNPNLQERILWLTKYRAHNQLLLCWVAVQLTPQGPSSAVMPRAVMDVQLGFALCLEAPEGVGGRLVCNRGYGA